jgi:hypothetical protein
MIVNAAVEGASDVGAARRVIEVAGHMLGRGPYIAGGKANLDPKIAKYNIAARWEPWIVFRDSDSQCPVRLRIELTSAIDVWSPRFLLRIAHSMTEAWFIADRDGFADYFRVSPGKVPADPEALAHGKRSLLALCRESSSRDVRQEVVAVDGGAGPLYVDHLNEFAMTRWDVAAATERSASLRRAVERICHLPADDR